MADVILKSDTLTSIADSIRAKNGSTNKYKPNEMSTAITNLSTGSSDVEINDMSYLFYQGYRINDLYKILPICKNVTRMDCTFADIISLDVSTIDIDFSNYQMESLESMVSTFSNSIYLTSINLSNLKGNNIINLDYTFSSCSSLTNIQLPNFIGEKVRNFDGVFSGCSAIDTSISLPLFTASYDADLINMTYAFYNCSSVKYIMLPKLSPNGNKIMNHVFDGCSNLEIIDMRSFNFENVTSYTDMLNKVPTTCQIIVKNDEQKNWFNTNFSSYTNIVIPSEITE